MSGLAGLDGLAILPVLVRFGDGLNKCLSGLDGCLDGCLAGFSGWLSGLANCPALPDLMLLPSYRS